MIEYYNLNKNNELLLCHDVKFDSNHIYNFFRKVLEEKGYLIEKFEKSSKSKYILHINDGDKTIKIILFIKNITGAGWKDKPKVKRVQVSNVMDTFESFNTETEKYYFMIVGYYNFDNNPIFAAWDAYRYINHNTIRSCYVSIDSLRRGYTKEYYVGVDSSQKIWIFKPQYINKFVEDYIKYVLERGGNY